MHLLIGLPLTLFRLLAGFVLLAFRLAVPILILVVIVLYLRSRRRSNPPPGTEDRSGDPHFDGPVYTVDYEDVPPEEEPDDHTFS